MVVSFANNRKAKTKEEYGKSFMYRRESNGPKKTLAPWVTEFHEGL